jgi:hypothetical protein
VDDNVGGKFEYFRWEFPNGHSGIRVVNVAYGRGKSGFGLPTVEYGHFVPFLVKQRSDVRADKFRSADYQNPHNLHY